METNKIPKAKIELKEVSGCGKITPSFLLSLGNKDFSVGVKGSILVESLPAETNLTISAVFEERTIGQLRVPYVSLFKDKFSYVSEKWLKIKTDEFQNFRIKLASSFVTTEKTVKEKAKTVKAVPEKKEDPAGCPFLNKLVMGQGISEPLDEIWRSRFILKENNVKISFEADPKIQNETDEVDLTSLNYEVLQTLNGNQLKSAVKALCSEIQSLEEISRSLLDTKSLFDSKVSQRKSLQQKGKNDLNQINNNLADLHKDLLEQLLERSKAKNLYLLKVQETADLEKSRDKLRQDLANTQSEYLYHSLTSRSESSRSLISSQLSSYKSSVKSEQSKNQSEIQKISAEIKDLKQSLKSAAEEYEKTKTENLKLRKKINDLNGFLHSNSSKADSFLSYLNTAEIRDKLNEKILSSIAPIQSKSILLEASQKTKSNDLTKSLLNNSDLLSSQVLSSKALSSMKIKRIESDLELISKSFCFIHKSDLEKITEDFKTLKSLYMSSRVHSLPELEAASNILAVENEKNLIVAEKLDKMIDAVDEQEAKLEGLKDSMGQIKKRTVFHVPAKNDPVDAALAEYVNNREVPVRFLRQDAGNYLFGSTKVFIKFENGRLAVRFRGGFTTLEEFLNIYIPIELNKADSPKGQKSRGKSIEKAV